ncbi:MAG: hypothetical protein J7515_00145 [Caulobacter sp.]|nr:hypothetical protein [Caulobacter sp.]
MGAKPIRRSPGHRPPQPRLPAINVIMAGVALWLLLGIAAQVAIRLVR